MADEGSLPFPVPAPATEPEASAGTQARPAEAPRPLYFVNAPVDWLLVGGGSILAFLGLWAFGPPTRTEAVIAVGGWLSWVCNWPHFAATLWRLYRCRENVLRFPLTALLVPPVVLLGAAASFASPEQVAPAFVKLFLLWSPYHFSGQTVGITLVYARRAGFQVGALERLMLSGFVFGTFISATARAEAGEAATPYFGLEVPMLGLPDWVGSAATVAMWLCAAGFVALVLRWCVLRKRLAPPILLVPAFAQLVWFVLGSGTPAFYEFVPAFHGLQYLLVAWTMQVRERRDARNAPLDLTQLSLEWYAGNVALGALLFWGLPRLFASGAGLDVSMPIVIAAVQIHHFFVDGVIWKLRDPAVGERLTGGLAEAGR